jgi:hypothetical protein
MTSRSHWLGALGSALLLGSVLGGCATTLSVPPVAIPSGAKTAIPSGASALEAIEIAPGNSGSGLDELTVCTFHFDFTMGANSSGTYAVKTLGGQQGRHERDVGHHWRNSLRSGARRAEHGQLAGR